MTDGRHPRYRETGPGGVRGIVMALLSSLADYLKARTELLRLEAREAGATVGHRIALVAGAVLLFFFAYVCLATGLVPLIAKALDKPWPVIALYGAGLHAGLGIGLLVAAKNLPAKSLFQDTIKEFEKDRQWLRDQQDKE